ncbi:MAG: hypothetical protein E7265_00450 [Lachnospiraceae bacterium]|nr:hypothetical protein [Lachnospiraceae bacterium]
MRKTINYLIVITLFVLAVQLFATTVCAGDFTDDFVISTGIITEYNGSGGDVVIPEGVYGFGEGVFSCNNTITSIVIPDSVNLIPKGAFKGCTGLKNVTLPSKITGLPYELFSGCISLESVDIPAGVNLIESYAFYGCKSLKTVSIPEGIKRINSSAFGGCTGLAAIEIPAGYSMISYDAFDPSIKVSVKIDYSQINYLELSKNKVSVSEGMSFSIGSSFTLNNCEMEFSSSDAKYRHHFIWTSSDESIVRSGMNEEPGGFLAMKPGTAILTLSVGNVKKEVSVTVSDNKRIFYVVPKPRYNECIDIINNKGIHATTKEEVYRHVYNQLVKGDYEFAVYDSDKINVKETIIEALKLYEAYIIVNNKPKSLTSEWYVDIHTNKTVYKSENAMNYDWGNYYYVKDENGNKVVIWRLYNPNSFAQVKKLNKKADDIIRKIIKKNMTSKQKMKAIHDYLIKNVKYDMRAEMYVTIKGKKYKNKEVLPEISHTAYGALIKKVAVCDGYSHAFSLLASKAGISSVVVGGKGHAWNLVKVNNKFKYIDVTYDDPVNSVKQNKKKPFAPSKNRIVSYKFFCVTAKAIKKNHLFNDTIDYQSEIFTEKWHKNLWNRVNSMRYE